ncbi:MAG: fibrobacter succinogenes major paralogous domain-containing protein [Flavobacteriaceae bacterium]
MKKLILLSALLIFACSSDDEGNPCIYEPTLSTEAVTEITETSATLNGIIDVTSENCDVPNNTEQGFVYSTEIQPTIEDIQVNVNGTNISTTLEGLTPNTTFYVRSFLTNALGEFYGNEIDFTTEESCNETGTVTDQDGNSYDYLCYGDQVWTVENAEMVTYRDGTPITQVTDQTEWANLTTGAWCYYNNDPTKPRFYNWYAVMGMHDTDPNTPNKEFAPEDWHVPSDTEWTTLENYLIANGYNYDGTTTGNKLAKSMASTTGWDFSTTAGAPGNDQSLNNSSGFNAFPEGDRLTNGSFILEGYNVFFWSSTGIGSSSNSAWDRNLENINSGFYRNNNNWRNGFSVRFVRD